MEEITFSGQRVAFGYIYMYVCTFIDTCNVHPYTCTSCMYTHMFFFSPFRCSGKVTSLNGHPLEGVAVTVCALCIMYM